MKNERCTKCHQPRPKGARWFWINANVKPPIVLCPPCAAIDKPELVQRRVVLDREARARATARARRRRTA